ncbi:MAG: nucleotide sugar dehydrogenase [Chloroflexota bacterium]|nr:nucleotide sugar dehydrogenase [Chloroflexota bacterium]
MRDQARNAGCGSATVAVVGLGKIGLPLAIQFVQHGRRVIGCDINPEVVAMINAGQSHVQEEPELPLAVASAVASGALFATLATAEAVRQAGVVVIVVPVVTDARHEVNFQAIDAATAAIGAGLQPGTLVIYETTLPVGTTAVRLRQLLEQTAQLRAGQDFLLAYSPERVSSGHIFRDLRTYPKVVGGINEQSQEAAVAFYQSVLDASIITMASMDEAEFVKLIETTYRDVNIALANEFACFADAYKLDVVAAIAAANTQPYSHIHTPGVGVGGHCIPVYPYFLLAGVEHLQPPAFLPDRPLLQLPRAARRINDGMAQYAVQRIEASVGSLEGQAVLILGVAYRGDVRETAFTSARLLQAALWERGATIYADDPLYSEDELQALGFMPLRAEQAEEIQAIVLQAGHQAYQEYDFSRFPSCRMLLDGRRTLNRAHIESLGMHYVAIGDGDREKSQPQRERDLQLAERG